MNPREKRNSLPVYKLFLKYDGREYIILRGKAPVYMPGDIICELERATEKLDWVKELILGCNNYTDVASISNLAQALSEIDKKIDYYFGTASGAVLMNVLSSRTQILLDCLELSGRYDAKRDFKIKASTVKRLLVESRFEALGAENVGHALLSGLALSTNMIAQFYELGRLVMNELADVDAEKRDTSKIKHVLYDNGDLIAAQQIDYRIMNIDEKISSVYGINDIMSVLMFELANCINNDVVMKKCNNCGHYFTLYGRPDVIYCSFAAPNGNKKICKDVGAQVKRANKEKNDAVTSEYRRVYFRKKMQVRRHPDDEKYQEMLSEFLTECKKWKEAIKNNMKSDEEYLSWLQSV